MGLSEFMQKNLYEMFSSKSYENSSLAQKERQEKAMKKQNGIVHQSTRGLSNGIHSRVYADNMMPDEIADENPKTDRPLPATSEIIDPSLDSGLQLGE